MSYYFFRRSMYANLDVVGTKRKRDWENEWLTACPSVCCSRLLPGLPLRRGRLVTAEQYKGRCMYATSKVQSLSGLAALAITSPGN